MSPTIATSQPLRISQAQARILMLKRQYLWHPRTLLGQEGVLQFLERMRFIQFDPVNIVGTSPCIVLAARVRDFKPQMLDDLLYKQRRLYDQWDRCASIVLDEDIEPLYMNRGDTNWRPRSDQTVPEEVYQQVIERFRSEGVLSTSAFRDIDQREALMQLLPQGVVEIHHREGQRRFFSLTSEERRLRLQKQDHFASREEFFRWMILRRIGSAGLIGARSSQALYSIRGLAPAERLRILKDLAAEGQIQLLKVEGLNQAYYCLSEDLPAPDEDEIKIPHATFMAPLDNMLWDRKLIEQLFHFSYIWEIYTKPEKRVYGPYTLPVLYGDRFVARAQLRKEQGRLVIESWWWEEQVRVRRTMLKAIGVALAAHADMLDLECDIESELKKL